MAVVAVVVAPAVVSGDDPLQMWVETLSYDRQYRDPDPPLSRQPVAGYAAI